MYITRNATSVSESGLRYDKSYTGFQATMTCGRKVGEFDCCSVVEGNNITVLRTLPECVDIVITSPPYNLGNNHHTGNKRVQAYTDYLPEAEYQDKQKELLACLFKITKKEGSLFYNHKNRISKGISISPYLWIFRTPWIVKQELVWFNGSQNFDKIRFYPMTERVYWLAKDSHTKLENNINHHDYFSKSDWPPVKTGGHHARAFPEKMVADVLSCFPLSNFVLDPYCGSGTSLAVAKSMNRHFLGIEIEPKYVAIARQRLADIPFVVETV